MARVEATQNFGEFRCRTEVHLVNDDQAELVLDFFQLLATTWRDERLVRGQAHVVLLEVLDGLARILDDGCALELLNVRRR